MRLSEKINQFDKHIQEYPQSPSLEEEKQVNTKISDFFTKNPEVADKLEIELILSRNDAILMQPTTHKYLRLPLIDKTSDD